MAEKSRCTRYWRIHSHCAVHQVGIYCPRGLVQEIDGQAGRHDVEPGSVCMTGPSPITWLPWGHTNHLIYQ